MRNFAAAEKSPVLVGGAEGCNLAAGILAAGRLVAEKMLFGKNTARKKILLGKIGNWKKWL